MSRTNWARTRRLFITRGSRLFVAALHATLSHYPTRDGSASRYLRFAASAPALPAGAGRPAAVTLLANVSDLAAIPASTGDRRFPVGSRVAGSRKRALDPRRSFTSARSSAGSAPFTGSFGCWIRGRNRERNRGHGNFTSTRSLYCGFRHCGRPLRACWPAGSFESERNVTRCILRSRPLLLLLSDHPP